MTSNLHYTRGFVLLALLPSFIAAGGNPLLAFEAVDLPAPEELKADQILPPHAYYNLLEEMTRQLGDQHFPAKAGAWIARSGLPVLREARNQSNSIAEFLVRLQIVFRKTVTNGMYELSSDGARAFIRLKRKGVNDRSTDKVDALNAAAFLTIFSDEVGDGSLSRLTVILPDPSYLPQNILAGGTMLRSREKQMEISFPTVWLLKPLRHRWRGPKQTVDHLTKGEEELSLITLLAERIRSRLPHGPVHLPDLALDLSTSVRKLQRSLQANGTSFRQIVAGQRLEVSRSLLASTDRNIHSISMECGYASPQAFSRAFFNAFGQTPSAFRAALRT